MKYFYVLVQDRQTEETVTVGAMLTSFEANALIKVLETYNATDIFIYAEEMK